MHPRLFSLFDFGFPSYFVLLVTGFVLATAIGVMWARRVGQNPDVIVDLGIAMLIAGVVGARIGHVLFDGMFWDYVHLCTDPGQVLWKIPRAECLRVVEPGFLGGGGGTVGHWDAAVQACRPPAEPDCLAVLRFSGGLTYYGGFIGAAVAAYFLLKRDRFPFFRAADMAGMVVPFGLGFGRLGCTLGGCCFGRPFHGAWALVFPPHSPAVDKQWQMGLLDATSHPSLPVHPTQLYEAFGAFVISAVLVFFVHGRKRYDGHVFVLFVTLYAALRFFLEFFRADDRGTLLGLSTSQFLGAALVVAALAAHRFLSRRVEVPR